MADSEESDENILDDNTTNRGENLIEIEDGKFKRPSRLSMELFRKLNQLRIMEDEGFCDIKLEAQGKLFPAHRCILAINSEFFESLFRSGMIDSRKGIINLQGISCKVMPDILEFFYTQEIQLNQENLPDVMEAASFLLLHSLKDACEKMLSRNLSVENCFTTRRIASTFDAQFLLKSVKDFIKYNFYKIGETSKEFLCISTSELTELLKLEDIRVEEESQVLSAVIRWIEHDLPARQAELSSLLQHVKLHLIPEEYLKSQLQRESLVAQSDLCEKILSEGLEKMSPLRPSTSVHSILVATSRYYGITCYDLDDEEEFSLPSMPPNMGFICVAAIDNVLYFLGNKTAYRNKGRRRGKKGYKTLVNCTANCLYSFSLSKKLPEPRESCGWKELAPPNRSHKDPSLVVLGGKLYVYGEPNETSLDNATVECYDPEKDSWSVLPALPSPRFHLTLVSTGASLLGLGGAPPTKKADEYNPKTNSWIALPPMYSKYHCKVNVVYHNGKVFVFNNYRLSCCEVYDVNKKTWGVIANLPQILPTIQSMFLWNENIIALLVDNVDNATLSTMRYNAKNNVWEDFPMDFLTHCLDKCRLNCFQVKKFDLENLESIDDYDSDSSSLMESE